MKNSIFIILSLLFFSCNKKTNNLAEIEINKVQNFGDIANTIAGNARRLFGEQLHVSVPRTLAGKGNAPDASVRHRPYAVRLRWKHYEATLIVDISRK